MDKQKRLLIFPDSKCETKASGWADNNTNTRTFTRLTVDAPTGETIAYVLIHDTGNYWLMDDLCTDANKAVIPVPGRLIGSHSDKFDIVFVPDNDYGSPADIDTWLPTFLDHINDQIDERLDGAAPVTGNLCKFNFYYTRMQGTASSKTLPANLTLLAPFADAFVIFHNAVFGDSCRMSTPSIYGAEGPVGRSFIHESGHGIFGLADEYDGCGTFYFQPNPMPNIWATEADGRADATSEGWDPDDIWKFTECQGDWWKLGTTEYIMFDGTRFANGWGIPAERRIQWFLDQFPACEVGEAAEAPIAEKAIWLNLQVSAGVFSLVEESFVTDSAPNYLPGEYDFTVKVFSNGGGFLAEYGIHDPRRIIAESDYEGPTWLDSTNFQLIVPYFDSCGRVDLIESVTGNVVISVDISQYATVFPPVINCPPDVTVECDQPTDPSNTGMATASVPNLVYSDEETPGICPQAKTIIRTWTATDDSGLSSICMQIIEVGDTTPPVITCPADVTIECDQSTDPSNTGEATATDNCDTAPDVIYSDVETPGACPQEKTITRTWTATDACGNQSSCVQTINVVDTTPPVIEDLSVSPNTLWPPNHKMVLIMPSITATDNCDSNLVVRLDSITMNEGDETNTFNPDYDSTPGDGHTYNDIEVDQSGNIYLRAERSGTGSGRIYTLTYVATDASGNSVTASTIVTVPHNQ